MSLYITIEGPEATGKSTQAEALYKRIKTEMPDQEVVLTKEPGSKLDDVCQQIRGIILNPNNHLHDKAALLLFLADRSQHMASVVLPALERGAIVISDRSSLSTIVYHAAKLIVSKSNDNCNHLYEMIDYAQTRAPDLCFVTNSNFNWASRKLGDRASLDRIELFGEMFHRAVHSMFKEIALEELPISNYIIFGIRQRMSMFPKKILFLPDASKNSILDIGNVIFSNVIKTMGKGKNPRAAD